MTAGRPRVSVTLTDDKLVRLYYSRQPIRLLCDEYDVEEYALCRAWGALKVAGRIQKGKRPVDRTAFKLKDHPPLSDQDGRPTVGDYDELLDKLYEVHKEPRYDIAKPEDLVVG